MHIFGKLKLSALASLVVTLGTMGAGLGPARAQDATGLDSISAEYHDMLDLFYRPLDPRDLLQAGWNALSQVLGQERMTAIATALNVTTG